MTSEELVPILFALFLRVLSAVGYRASKGPKDQIATRVIAYARAHEDQYLRVLAPAARVLRQRHRAPPQGWITYPDFPASVEATLEEEAALAAREGKAP